MSDFGLEKYDREISIGSSHLPGSDSRGYNEVIHYAIPVALGFKIMNHHPDYQDIFDIEDVSRVLTEGYKFENGVVTEDFAITSSSNGGELIVGQVVSCNGKEYFGDKPFDVIQAENFVRALEDYNNSNPDITGIYTVRTTLDPGNVKKKEQEIKAEIEENGEYVLPLEIIRLDNPEDIPWSRLNNLLHEC